MKPYASATGLVLFGYAHMYQIIAEAAFEGIGDPDVKFGPQLNCASPSSSKHCTKVQNGGNFGVID